MENYSRVILELHPETEFINCVNSNKILKHGSALIFVSFFLCDCDIKILTGLSHLWAWAYLHAAPPSATGWRLVLWLHWRSRTWLRGVHYTGCRTHLLAQTHIDIRKYNCIMITFTEVCVLELLFFFTWCWSLIGDKVTLADHLAVGGKAAKVQHRVHF